METEKRTMDTQFNVVDVINKTYADATQYDLNDTLIFLANGINKTKARNKQLVKQHFSKFVQCRVVLEEIWNNIRQKGYDREFTAELEENIRIVERKFNEMTRMVLDDSRSEVSRDRRRFYLTRYRELFSIKETLKAGGSLERFAEAYGKARAQYEELRGSRYVQRLWSSIHEERCEYLEAVYRNIQRPGSTFYEALYYFNLYFKVSERKTERKIMNTLLVNFKENTARELWHQPEELCELYGKLMEHLDSELQVEGTKHFYDCLERALDGAKVYFIKIWMKKLAEMMKILSLSADAARHYVLRLKKYKISVIDSEFGRAVDVCMENLKDTVAHYRWLYELLADVASSEEENYLRAKLLERIELCFKHVTRFSDLEATVRELNELRPLLGKNRHLKLYYRIVDEQLENWVARVSEGVTDRMERGGTDAALLAEVARVMEEMPVGYMRVVRRLQPLIQSRRVAAYYLRDVLEVEVPALTNEERAAAERISYQFGFLRE
jgi:hypothetical protein